jgi:hypothetical protein
LLIGCTIGQARTEGKPEQCRSATRLRHQGIGQELSKAKTYDKAKEAVEPFVKLIGEPDVRWLIVEEAKASGYDDPGNPELTNA